MTSGAALAGELAPQPDGKPHLCAGDYAAAWMTHAKRRGAYGARNVQLNFRIAKDGTVEDVVVHRSSDDEDADRLAKDCVARWTYAPVIKDGRPVELDWSATVSFSMTGAYPPGGDAFDIPASNRDNQTCKLEPAADLEARWSRLSSSGYAGPSGDNAAFECLSLPGNNKLCRAKPASPLYPTVASVIALSTGSKVKLAVDVSTTGDCNAILPLKFQNEVPVSP